MSKGTALLFTLLLGAAQISAMHTALPKSSSSKGKYRFIQACSAVEIESRIEDVLFGSGLLPENVLVVWDIDSTLGITDTQCPEYFDVNQKTLKAFLAKKETRRKLTRLNVAPRQRLRLARILLDGALDEIFSKSTMLPLPDSLHLAAFVNHLVKEGYLNLCLTARSATETIRAATLRHITHDLAIQLTDFGPSTIDFGTEPASCFSHGICHCGLNNKGTMISKIIAATNKDIKLIVVIDDSARNLNAVLEEQQDMRVLAIQAQIPYSRGSHTTADAAAAAPAADTTVEVNGESVRSCQLYRSIKVLLRHGFLAGSDGDAFKAAKKLAAQANAYGSRTMRRAASFLDHQTDGDDVPELNHASTVDFTVLKGAQIPRPAGSASRADLMANLGLDLEELSREMRAASPSPLQAHSSPSHKRWSFRYHASASDCSCPIAPLVALPAQAPTPAFQDPASEPVTEQSGSESDSDSSAIVSLDVASCASA